LSDEKRRKIEDDEERARQDVEEVAELILGMRWDD
jgi:hypothetical protein